MESWETFRGAVANADRSRSLLLLIDLTSFFDVCELGSFMRHVRDVVRKHRSTHTVLALNYHEMTACDPSLADKVIRHGSDDKSDAVMRYAREHNIVPNVIRVCGVNTSSCVAATVHGCRRLYPRANIIVHADACRNRRGHDGHVRALRDLAWYSQVSVVGAGSVHIKKRPSLHARRHGVAA